MEISRHDGVASKNLRSTAGNRAGCTADRASDSKYGGAACRPSSLSGPSTWVRGLVLGRLGRLRHRYAELVELAARLVETGGHQGQGRGPLVPRAAGPALS